MRIIPKRVNTKTASQPTKDVWDILQIVMALAIPAAIAYVGHVYSNATKEAEIATQKIIKETELASKELIEANKIDVAWGELRIEQAKTADLFFDRLLSENTETRKLASEALLVALPNHGQKLVQIVANFDQDEGVRKSANAALDTNRILLIVGMFSEIPAERKNSFDGLISVWANDPSLAKDVLDFASANTDNLNGVYNSLVLLSHMKPDALKPHKKAIIAFSRAVEKNGSKTKARAEKLRSRLPK